MGPPTIITAHGRVGVQRATFIIGPDSRIIRVFEKVSPKTHDDLVLEALAELQATAT